MFTEFVRTLIGGAERLDGEAFAVLWGELRVALRAELRRRGLWSAPPSYLGIYGWTSWEQHGDGEALEELAGACYTFIFVSRLRSLAAQLRVKPDVEGLVLLGIRHFLHELQRQHDPLGYRVFAVARAAVRLALARGEILLQGGDPRVRNDTVLAFGPVAERSGGAEAGARGAAAAAPGAELRDLVRRWNDQLLPDLVTASGRAQEQVAERLSRCLSDLRRHGFQSVRFKELIDPLKSDVRSRWAAFLRQTGQLGGTVPAGESTGQGGGLAGRRPDLDLEERAGFSALSRSVAAAVDRLDTDARTRDYLARLWRFLSTRAAQDEGRGGEAGEAGEGGAEGGEGGAEGGGRAARGSGGERALSHRKLARLLEIPRQRLPELHQTLGLLVQRCRDAGGDAGSAAVRHPLAPGRALETAVPAAEPAGDRDAVRRR